MFTSVVLQKLLSLVSSGGRCYQGFEKSCVMLLINEKKKEKRQEKNMHAGLVGVTFEPITVTHSSRCWSEMLGNDVQTQPIRLR